MKPEKKRTNNTNSIATRLCHPEIHENPVHSTNTTDKISLSWFGDYVIIDDTPIARLKGLIDRYTTSEYTSPNL